jgi:hypothetical protein
MILHLALSTEIVPGPTDSLQRHPVVEEAADDSEGHQIPKGVEPSDARSAAAGLNRRFDQSYPVPIAKLMMCAVRQPASLLGCK